MSKILCIETATKVCSVALSINGQCSSFRETDRENSHSTDLTIMIQDLMAANDLKISDLDAIAISKGPGSYTGLRIGASVAKGICYALNLPLVAVPTLQAIAAGMKEQLLPGDVTTVLCPMIDARRMEVYTAKFDINLNEISAVKPLVIGEQSYTEFSEPWSIAFAGDGSDKAKPMLSRPGASWLHVQASARWMCGIAHSLFSTGTFQSTAYFAPFYLKEFQATTPRARL